MIPNIHQSIEEIIKSATPVEKLLWQQARLLTGENAAIRQLYYEGTIVGSEFLTYSANKLYICQELEASTNFVAATVNSGSITVYDPVNNACMMLQANYPVWNTTAAALYYNVNSLVANNFIFSRLVQLTYLFIKFIGYRLTR